MYARITEIKRDFHTTMERDDAMERALRLQTFRKSLEQTRLEAAQAKQISGEMARTVEALTAALADSQRKWHSAWRRR